VVTLAIKMAGYRQDRARLHTRPNLPPGYAWVPAAVRAKLTACGVPIPKRTKNQPKEERRIPPHRLRFVGFHTFRHTWATWLRRYGGADVQGLIATGNWRDPRSAARYAHVEPRDEWARVEKLPSIERGQSVETQKTGT
jgi:integrase